MDCLGILFSVLHVRTATASLWWRPRDHPACVNWSVYVFRCVLVQPDGEDDLKRRQLMELAIINGTYRDTVTALSPTAVLTGAAAATALPTPVSRTSSVLLHNILHCIILYGRLFTSHLSWSATSRLHFCD